MTFADYSIYNLDKAVSNKLKVLEKKSIDINDKFIKDENMTIPYMGYKLDLSNIISIDVMPGGQDLRHVMFFIKEDGTLYYLLVDYSLDNLIKDDDVFLQKSSLKNIVNISRYKARLTGGSPLDLYAVDIEGKTYDLLKYINID